MGLLLQFARIINVQFCEENRTNTTHAWIQFNNSVCPRGWSKIDNMICAIYKANYFITIVEM
jgi:hypothetical protein